jgi:hypothetical protein
MWSHMSVASFTSRFRARLRNVYGGIAVVCVLALLASGSAVSAAAGPSQGSGASLTFPSGKAQLVGSQALVLVRCLGPQTAACNGTLTLGTSGHRHKVPFSVFGGTSQSLTVPLGSDAGAVKRAMAVARTAQQGGGYTRSSEVLHFR